MQSNINPLGQPVGIPAPNWTPPAILPHEVLVGHYCRVEPLDADRHAASLFEASCTDTADANWTYLPYGPFDSFESYRAWLSESARKSDPQFFAIVETSSGRALGIASYLRIDPRNGSIEVGHINFSPLLQRTAAATEAMYLMMERAFRLGYRRYEWKCDALNAASRRAAMRLGLSFERPFIKAATATRLGSLPSTGSGPYSRAHSCVGSTQTTSTNAASRGWHSRRSPLQFSLIAGSPSGVPRRTILSSERSRRIAWGATSAQAEAVRTGRPSRTSER